MIEQLKQKKSRGFLTILIIGAIAVASLGLVVLINSTEPEAQREAATKKTAMLVEVQTVKRGTFTPQIEGLGIVTAAQDITLSPRVAGRIIEVSENFIPGGFVKKGDVLLTIDPADYKNQVQQMQSALAQAKAEFSIELGRRDVAAREYAMLGQTLNENNKDLVLREPQLSAASAAVDSAEAMLKQARLELERTVITAPFDAQILSRDVNVGSEVGTNTELARLIGIDEYWVTISVPMAKLSRISLPTGEEDGALVEIRNRTAWPEEAMREGRVMRLIGALDDQTRLARILVSVKDPLGLDTEAPQLLVGSIVQAEIAGKPLENVIRIERDYLRDGDRVWLKRDGKLVMNDATVVFKDKDYAYISGGLQDGDLLVTSNLATVVEGIDLRTEAEAAP
jgi:RND family efflux transporter MFP subunit